MLYVYIDGEYLEYDTDNLRVSAYVQECRKRDEAVVLYCDQLTAERIKAVTTLIPVT